MAPITLINTQFLDQENVTVIQLFAPDAGTESNRALLEDGLESPAIIKKIEPYGRSSFIHLTKVVWNMYLIFSRLVSTPEHDPIQKLACFRHMVVVDIAVEYSLLVRQLRRWIAVDDGCILRCAEASVYQSFWVASTNDPAREL